MLIISIVFLLTFRIIDAQGQSLIRLSTKEISVLHENDYIYSTLGRYRMSFIPMICNLKIEAFDGKQYRIKGYYPNLNNQMQKCEYMILGQGHLLNSRGISILRIQSSDFSSIEQTIFNIDDIGIIRIIGFHPYRPNLVSGVSRITVFREPSTSVYSTSEISVVAETDTLSLRKNKRGWGFSAFKGQLRVFMLSNVSKIVKYKYQSFRIIASHIFDKKNLEPPVAHFQGFKYGPRCGYVKFVNFKAPFVFEMNEFWPELRVLDQGGYQLLSIRYPDFKCFNDLGFTTLVNAEQCLSWFCPKQTFSFEQKCMTKCPNQYYHQIKPNGKNKCVLVCEEGSIQTVYNDMKICTCGQAWEPPACLNNSQSGVSIYALGCQCQSVRKNIFFNGFQCSSKCPYNYYAHQDGICILCPNYCESCVKSSGRMQSISFLSCTKCYQGFQIIEGFCKKRCTQSQTIQKANNKQDTSISLVSNLFCQKCQSQYCIKCASQSPRVCEICAKPFLLFKNTCIRNCPPGFTYKFTRSSYQNQFHFICQKINKCSHLSQSSLPIQACKKCNFEQNICLKNCSMGQIYKNQSKCYCQMQESKYYASTVDQIINYGFVENCLSFNPEQQFNLCPYKYYLYEKTKQCLACPFGCLSCQQDGDGLMQCTSCAPSYFLVIMNERGRLYCQRDTSLVGCESQQIYDSVNKICHLGYARQSYRLFAKRTLCYKFSPNCLLCLEESRTYCTFCKPSYVLYLGQCLPNCPQGTLQYHRVCLIIPTDSYRLINCLLPKVVSKIYAVNIDMQSQFSQGYQYFLPRPQGFKFLKTIDPIGKSFQNSFVNKKTIKGTKQSYYDQGTMICNKCLQFHKQNPLTNLCQPVLDPQKCEIYANSMQNFCLKCFDDYNLDKETRQCIQKKQQNKNCKVGQLRNSMNKCITNCYGFYLYEDNVSHSVNCTKVCPYNVSGNQNGFGYLKCDKTGVKEGWVDDDSMFMSGTHYRLSNRKDIVFLIPIKNGFSVNQRLFLTPNAIDCSYMKKSQKEYKKCKPSGLQIQNKQDKKLRRSLQSTQNPQTQLIQITPNKLVLAFSNLQNPSSLSLELMTGFFSQQPPYLTNSQFIFTTDTPQYNQLLNNQLSAYGKIYTFVLMIMAVLFMGSHILYKIDNLMIVFQILPLFLFSINLTQIESKDYYRFLYGFKWSIGHIFGAPQAISIDNDNQIPYIENSPNTAHHLINIDNNIFRNTYILLIILVSYAVICLLLILIMKRIIKNSQKKHQNTTKQLQTDIDHSQQLINFLIFLLQNSSLPILYYSLSTIQNQGWSFTDGTTFRTISIIFSIFFIIILALYTLFRFYVNNIGGLYMLKRFQLAIILSLIQGNSYIIIYAIIGQVIFTIFRFYLQIFQFINHKKLKKQKTKIIILTIQQILICISYVMLGLTDQVSANIAGVIVFVIFCGINVGVICLFADFIDQMVDIYRKQEKNRPQQLKVHRNYIQRIRKMWDYQKQTSITTVSSDQLKAV